ncbi:uncharacterized protein LOC113089630 [Carassius auratus]|uniref:ubiquitinyl hydrolase 1 n=1 Tax=Carassius auratus TaxID=7957 RepID=A0A6P6NTE7_CARAU|nr:uncharacterized protein LOC113089630 [Carassius auratus]
MIDGNGFSVAVYHKTLASVLRHIKNLAACMRGHEKFFEITGVCVHQIKISNTCHSQAEISSDKTETRYCVGKKRKIQTLPLSSEEMTECKDVKKRKYNFKENREIIESISKCSSNADVICLGDRANTVYDFSPLCFETKQKLCSKVHVEFQGENLHSPSDSGPMGSPCETESILEDGNCFFRAVAQVICGTQKAHRTLRLAIVKHMQLHSVEYKNLLRSQYTSMEDYLSSSKMKYVGTWATEVEIQSTANYLGVDIFTFHLGKWLKFSCLHEKMCNQGIYLHHSNENHYEVVVCVKQFESHNCYEFCHNKKHNVGIRTRTRQSVKAQSEVYETQETKDSDG